MHVSCILNTQPAVLISAARRPVRTDAVVDAPPPPLCPLQTHLPGFIKEADTLKATGVDEIVCMAVNDPFVTAGWAKAQGATGKVRRGGCIGSHLGEESRGERSGQTADRSGQLGEESRGERSGQTADRSGQLGEESRGERSGQTADRSGHLGEESRGERSGQTVDRSGQAAGGRRLAVVSVDPVAAVCLHLSC